MRSRAAAGCLLALAATLPVAAPGRAEAAKSNCSYDEGPDGGRIYYDVFVIFFELDSDTITPTAASILDNAAEAYADVSHCAISIAGHADRSGPAAYNRALAERRGQAVAAYFRSHGIRSKPIVETYGEERLLVITPDGAREPQNRRVEIVLVPPERKAPAAD